MTSRPEYPNKVKWNHNRLSCMVFFRLPVSSKASYSEISFGRLRLDTRRRQGLQLCGRQTRPLPLQIGINAKIPKISPEWRRILIDEFFFYLFAEFQLHPSNSSRGNRRWSHKNGLLNMIGAKLSDQKNAGCFKSTNQRLAFCSLLASRGKSVESQPPTACIPFS